MTMVYSSKHRRADGGPAPQISLAIQEVLPHPAGLSGGGVPDTLRRRWQALQRGVQRKHGSVLCGGLHRYLAWKHRTAVPKVAIKKVMLCSEASLASPEDRGLFLYSRCRVTTTSGPSRRRAESTTERKTDIPTFCHVSEDL